MSAHPNLMNAYEQFQLAQRAFEEAMEKSGLAFEKTGFDSYDQSVEIYEAPAGSVLTAAMQKLVYDFGFSLAFLNRQDGNATAYRVWKNGEFQATDGGDCGCRRLLSFSPPHSPPSETPHEGSGADTQ